MDINIRQSSAGKCRSDCIVVTMDTRRRFSLSGKEIDKLSRGQLTRLARRGDISGKVAATTVILDLSRVSTDRVIVVGSGANKRNSDKEFRKMAAAVAETLIKTGARDAVSYISQDAEIEGRDLYWCCRQEIEVLRDKLFKVEHLQVEPGRHAGKLKRYSIGVGNKEDVPATKRAVHDGVAISNGTDLARGLGNLPPNICTPTFLAKTAKQLFHSDKRIKIKVLGEAEMRQLGMGSMLSVSQGSRQPAKLIIFEYFGGTKSAKPVVLVGKGVTFDSGGISLKPGGAMDEMKFDMCGAASVFGTIRAVSDLDLEKNIIGVVPATENLPDGNATKPGDVVTSMSGQTIEILNTDAEGRLILCDAITYSERYEPNTIIDIATLTGACVVALGSHAIGLFSNNDDLSQDLVAAGKYSGDRAWPMPIWEDYQEQLRSNFADMANVGGRDAGAITAACFLARFARKQKWAHLDIAGAAWHSGAKKGATGRPVKLLTQYLLNLI